MIRTLGRRIAAGLVVFAVVATSAFVVNASLPIATGAGADEPITSFNVDYEPNSPDLPGYQLFARPPEYSITAAFDAGDHAVRMVTKRETPFDRWILSFEPPPGETLGVGTYQTAELASFGNLDGCSGWNYLEASFTVMQLELATPTSPARFAATFEQHCWNGETIYGSFFYNATGLAQDALLATQEIEFAGPGASDIVELTNEGTTEQPVRTEIAGLDAADFQISSSTCAATLAPGATCSITMRFSPTGSGGKVEYIPPRGGTRTAYLLVYDGTPRGERSVFLVGNDVGTLNVSLAVNRNPVITGQSITLTASVDRDVDQIQIWDGDEVVATVAAVNRQATVQLTLSPGSHWLVASASTPATGRSDSNPLLVVVNPT